MFLLFFDEYKEKIYKGSRRKLMWYEIILILALFIVGLFSLLSITLEWGRTVITVLFSILVVLVATICIYTDMDLKKNREALLNAYKGNHIEPLCQQLIKYNLYDNNGIDWLLGCCEKLRPKNMGFTNLSAIMKVFISVLYPTINLSLGLLLKEYTPDAIASFTVSLVALFIVGCGLILGLQPLVHFMLFPEKSIVDYLEKDLEYVRTQIKAKQQ